MTINPTPMNITFSGSLPANLLQLGAKTPPRIKATINCQWLMPMTEKKVNALAKVTKIQSN
jgi:hypothetical protein